jgi:hypothetical protein
MVSAKKIKLVLDRKLKKVRETPASFTFFVSLHDFVQYIESTPSFAVFFSGTKKGSRASEISPKYSVLREVYQGIEDIDVRTTNDLGHNRYVAIRDLSLIRNNDVSENNSFWKRRELLRKVAGEIHQTMYSYLSESDDKTKVLSAPLK